MFFSIQECFLVLDIHILCNHLQTLCHEISESSANVQRVRNVKCYIIYDRGCNIYYKKGVTLFTQNVRRFIFCILLCFIGCNLAYHVTQRTETRKIYIFIFLNFLSFFFKKERGGKVSFTHVLTMGILTHWLQMSYTMV